MTTGATATFTFLASPAQITDWGQSIYGIDSVDELSSHNASELLFKRLWPDVKNATPRRHATSKDVKHTAVITPDVVYEVSIRTITVPDPIMVTGTIVWEITVTSDEADMPRVMHVLKQDRLLAHNKMWHEYLGKPLARSPRVIRPALIIGMVLGAVIVVGFSVNFG